MKQFFYILMILPTLTNGQSLYSGKDKFKYEWMMKVNSDNSIILNRKAGNDGYWEYAGTISKTNDTLFTVKAKMIYGQGKCRAIGDSVIYATVDSMLQKEIKYITVKYSTGDSLLQPINGEYKIMIPIEKSLFNNSTNKNRFTVSTGRIDPMADKPILTTFKFGEEYCIEIYAQREIKFKMVIKKNTIRTIGKPPVDNLVLTRKSGT